MKRIVKKNCQLKEGIIVKIDQAHNSIVFFREIALEFHSKWPVTNILKQLI